MFKTSRMIVVMTAAALFCSTAYTEEAPDVHESIKLSPDTLSLLQAEMRELSVASQAIVTAYVSGDWQSIQKTSKQIRASYVMDKELTDAQKRELEHGLPERFKRLDAEFHARAEKLESAAANADAELTAFHYYRLLESCVACHTDYAQSRFPGLSASRANTHQH